MSVWAGGRAAAAAAASMSTYLIPNCVLLRRKTHSAPIHLSVRPSAGPAAAWLSSCCFIGFKPVLSCLPVPVSDNLGTTSSAAAVSDEMGDRLYTQPSILSWVANENRSVGS